MPYVADFFEEGRGLLFTGTGLVTAPEIVQAKKGLDSDRLKQIVYAICDLSEVEELRLSPDEIRAISRIDLELARIVPGAVVALVSPRADIYGLSRMWQVLVEDTGWVVAIFMSMDEAEKWVRSRTA
jgi:hypothetical protein